MAPVYITVGILTLLAEVFFMNFTKARSPAHLITTADAETSVPNS
jgi:hypothetical protein